MTREDELAWVATPEHVAELAAVLATVSAAAIDTEFVREKTYYPQLCLIQVATEERVACIDCLAAVDLTPVFAELFRPGFVWVLHSAGQDLEVIWQRTGRLPPRLVDTQIAASLTGMAAQVGLEGLLKETLGVTLGESYARTDWSRRPLPPEALDYALDDVRYLLAARARLDERLAELDRGAWLTEDCARVLAAPPTPDTLAVWQRLKGVHGLPLAGRAAALALVRWREAAAQRADRPRRWLLADETLLAIAAALPADVAALGRYVPPKFVARNGAAVLAALAQRADAALVAEVEAHRTETPPDRKIVKELQERVRERAAELGLEPEILATRRDLVAVAAGHAPEHLQRGWRATALAAALADREAPAG